MFLSLRYLIFIIYVLLFICNFVFVMFFFFDFVVYRKKKKKLLVKVKLENVLMKIIICDF